MPPTNLDKARADLLVPDFAKDNYDQMARDIAQNEDCTPKEGMAKLVAGWRSQHELKPLDGYDHLANWGDGRDPGVGVTDDLTAQAAAMNRAVESAKREPSAYLAGTEEVTEAATTAAEQASAPAVDDENTELNSGPAKDVPAKKTAASRK